MNHYTAKWGMAGQPTRGNVSYTARNDAEASRKADRIADEIGLPNTPRTIQRAGVVIQCLQTGKAVR